MNKSLHLLAVSLGTLLLTFTLCLILWLILA